MEQGRKMLGIFLVLFVCCSTVEIHQEDGVLDLMEEGLKASDQLTHVKYFNNVWFSGGSRQTAGVSWFRDP